MPRVMYDYAQCYEARRVIIIIIIISHCLSMFLCLSFCSLSLSLSLTLFLPHLRVSPARFLGRLSRPKKQRHAGRYSWSRPRTRQLHQSVSTVQFTVYIVSLEFPGWFVRVRLKQVKILLRRCKVKVVNIKAQRTRIFCLFIRSCNIE